MVQTFATSERVPSGHLSKTHPTYDAILNLPMSPYLASEEDEIILKDELTVIVARILSTYMPMFHDLHDGVCWNLPHPYQKDSAQ
jgi:hypothetical protein